jgi:YbbR domain-containing protein
MYRPSTPVKITFEPARVNVLLHGREDLIRKIADNAVVTFVDCSNLRENSSNIMPVNVYLPSGAGLNATITPERVKVVVHEMPKDGSEPANVTETDDK